MDSANDTAPIAAVMRRSEYSREGDAAAAAALSREIGTAAACAAAPFNELKYVWNVSLCVLARPACACADAALAVVALERVAAYRCGVCCEDNADVGGGGGGGDGLPPYCCWPWRPAAAPTATPAPAEVVAAYGACMCARRVLPLPGLYSCGGCSLGAKPYVDIDCCDDEEEDDEDEYAEVANGCPTVPAEEAPPLPPLALLPAPPLLALLGELSREGVPASYASLRPIAVVE